MLQKSSIARFFSLFLTVLMLFISVWSKAQVPHKTLKKTATEQSSKNDKAPKASISELSPMTTVVPVVVDFQQYCFLLPSTFRWVEAQKSPLSTYKTPLFRLSFFEKLFEKQIAIGAP
jgi:hypothetical protein